MKDRTGYMNVVTIKSPIHEDYRGHRAKFTVSTKYNDEGVVTPDYKCSQIIDLSERDNFYKYINDFKKKFKVTKIRVYMNHDYVMNV